MDGYGSVMDRLVFRPTLTTPCRRPSISIEGTPSSHNCGESIGDGGVSPTLPRFRDQDVTGFPRVATAGAEKART